MLYFVFRNPFGFYRKWIIPQQQASQENQIYYRYRENQIQQQFDQHKRQLDQMRKDNERERKLRERERKESRRLRKLLEQIANPKSTLQPTPSGSNQSTLDPSGSNQSTTDLSTETQENQNNKVKNLDNSKKPNRKKGKSLKRRKTEQTDDSDPDYTPHTETNSSGSSSDADEDENLQSTAASTSYYSCNNGELESRARSNSEQQLTQTERHCVPVGGPPLIPAQGPLGDITAVGDTVYVQQITLKITGDPVDSLFMINPEDEAVFDFVRMQTTNGFMNHVNTNSITYDKFR